jgi:hypothetical protein
LGSAVSRGKRHIEALPSGKTRVHHTKPVRCLDIQASFFYFFYIYYTHRGAQWFLCSCSDSAKSSRGQRGLEGRHQPSGLHKCNYLATYILLIENLPKKISLIATTQEDRGRGHATPKTLFFSCTGCFPLHSDGCYFRDRNAFGVVCSDEIRGQLCDNVLESKWSVCDACFELQGRMERYNFAFLSNFELGASGVCFSSATAFKSQR